MDCCIILSGIACVLRGHETRRRRLGRARHQGINTPENSLIVGEIFISIAVNTAIIIRNLFFLFSKSDLLVFCRVLYWTAGLRENVVSGFIPGSWCSNHGLELGLWSFMGTWCGGLKCKLGYLDDLLRDRSCGQGDLIGFQGQ